LTSTSVFICVYLWTSVVKKASNSDLKPNKSNIPASSPKIDIYICVHLCSSVDICGKKNPQTQTLNPIYKIPSKLRKRQQLNPKILPNRIPNLLSIITPICQEKLHLFQIRLLFHQLQRRQSIFHKP